MVKPPKQKPEFIFRQSDRIGAPAAENDRAFLSECFIDNGTANVLLDTTDSRVLLVGRTGSGKSALIAHMSESAKRSAFLSPQQVAVQHLTNSEFLGFLTEIGVHLDLFFKLLWKHVLLVEAIRVHFGLKSDQAKWRQTLSALFQTKSEKRAKKYLEDFGPSFWAETDHRLEEVSTTFTSDARARIQAKFPGLLSGVEEGESLSEEMRFRVRDFAQQIVNRTQTVELEDALRAFGKTLSDPQKPVHLLVDELDEDWAPEPFRTALLCALIDASRSMSRLPNLKVVVALRTDLYQQLLGAVIRTPGAQREKYEGQKQVVRWSREDLKALLNRRISKLYRNRYQKNASVSLDDIAPTLKRPHRSRDEQARQPASDYIVDRTLMRPRDAIDFVNLAIEQSAGLNGMTGRSIREAERLYSEGRLNALFDEWRTVHPHLHLLIRSRGWSIRERVESFADEWVDQVLSAMDQANLDIEDAAGDDSITRLLAAHCRGQMSKLELAAEWIRTLYAVGFLGVATRKGRKIYEFDNGPHARALRDLSTASIGVHLAFAEATSRR